MQAAHTAHDVIDADAIYSTTGSPHPQDIQKIVDWLFNAEFSEAYANIRALQLNHGLASTDIITKVFESVSALQLPAPVRIFLCEQLGEIEYLRLTLDMHCLLEQVTRSNLQLSSVFSNK